MLPVNNANGKTNHRKIETSLLWFVFYTLQFWEVMYPKVVKQK